MHSAQRVLLSGLHTFLDVPVLIRMKALVAILRKFNCLYIKVFWISVKYAILRLRHDCARMACAFVCYACECEAGVCMCLCVHVIRSTWGPSVSCHRVTAASPTTQCINGPTKVMC